MRLLYPPKQSTSTSPTIVPTPKKPKPTSRTRSRSTIKLLPSPSSPQPSPPPSSVPGPIQRTYSVSSLNSNISRTSRINHTALLETTQAILPEFVSTILPTDFEDPSVAGYQHCGPRSNTPKPPRFSCVIRNVDYDTTENELLEFINLPKITKAIGIISHQSGQPTTFIRLVTTSQSTRDFLLARGVTMFLRHYPCEPSRISAAIPKYCT
ncbi:hypothetical protein RI129_006651 [Pyrocoelia pectoralis]|uniref:Uncharacterized protein n=1 Tax=Pyrocoelia pectoralis TaxID=417401 RepID=A0AAN7ZPT1_9COLE